MDSPCSPKSRRLCALIRQLRSHKPETGLISGERATEKDDRGNVLSSVGFSESPHPSKILLHSADFHPKKAAVLICLFEDDNGDLRVILTKRSSNLSTHSGFFSFCFPNLLSRMHKYVFAFSDLFLGFLLLDSAGEVSLPGGKAEAGDADDSQTATREAKEEIGLDPSLVTVVTILEPFLSRHLLRVVPVIGVLSNRKAFKPAPNVFEVEAIFDAPLAMFLEDENHWSEEREWLGQEYLLHYFDYETSKRKFLVWGLTADILIHAASIVYQHPPYFTERKPKFLKEIDSGNE